MGYLQPPHLPALTSYHVPTFVPADLAPTALSLSCWSLLLSLESVLQLPVTP